jgi:hypothetical protein
MLELEHQGTPSRGLKLCALQNPDSRVLTFRLQMYGTHSTLHLTLYVVTCQIFIGRVLERNLLHKNTHIHTLTHRTVLSFESWCYVLGTQGDKEHVVGMYVQFFCSSALYIRRHSRVSSTYIQAVPGFNLGPETGYLDGNSRVFPPQPSHADARLS